MARSFIDPSLVAMAAQPAAPPWDWNPGATFVRAFNDAQALQLKREEIENERQIMEILLPYKVKKAQLDFDKLRSDVKVQEASMDIERDRLNFKNRALDEQIKSRNKPRAIFNPSTGVFEPADTGGASSSNFGTDADTPLPPMRSEGESTIFDDLEDTDLTSGLSYRVTDQTRDQLGQKSTAKNRQVSLDFNAGGDASTRGVEIVIPSDATPEERTAAEAYTTKLTDWFASKGVKVPNRGVLTKTGKGGSVNRFHTEPFFVQDAEARAAIESDPDGYASVLAGTLGRLPVTFIPPHTSKDPGAADGDINERDFARNTIIPALRRLQEGGTRSTQAASRSTRNPLVDDEDGFNNPLARLDEEAIVPIGAQYTGGETNVASGRFDASLGREEATSPVQEMGFDLGRFSASIPDEEQVPEDERIVREIQSRRQAFEQNIYDMQRQGFQIAPEELDRASVKIEREARAKLLPFAAKLGDVGQTSMNTLLEGGETFESAYLNVKRSVGASNSGAIDLKALDESMNQSSYRLTQLLGTGLDENAPEVKLERENLKRLGQQRLGIKETPEGLFMDIETKRQMIPVYAESNRPFDGRVDYDNISTELTDAQLAAGMEGLRSGSKMFVNMNSYTRTKDDRLTSDAFEQYKKDVAEAKKMFGQAVIFDGRKFSVTGKGEGETPATPEELATATTSTPVEGPDSAKAAAKALRDIGKATGMEDPPHIYAAKMYERYVGKPFTDAAWPWVRTFLQELNQPAGR